MVLLGIASLAQGRVSSGWVCRFVCAAILGILGMCALYSWLFSESLGQTIFGEIIAGTFSSLIAVLLAYLIVKMWMAGRSRKLERLVDHWWRGILLNLQWRPYDRQWLAAWNSWQEQLSRLCKSISPKLDVLMQVDSREIYDGVNEPDELEIAKRTLTRKLADLKEYLQKNLNY